MTSRLTPQRLQRLMDVASRRQFDFSIICENLHDPHNISAIIRSADGFGIQEISVVGVDENFHGHPKTSASARRWVDVKVHKSISESIAAAKSEGKRVFATRLDSQAKSIFEVDWTKPSAIILGNEHAGVSDEVVELADETIYIPMSGMVQSLNVSVANAVILTEVFRQRQLVGMYRSQLTYHRNELLNRWLQREEEKYT